MFGLKRALVENQDLNKTIRLLLTLFVSPELMQGVIASLQNTDKSWEGNFNLIDDKVVECFSMPLYVEGKYNVRVWGFRDVTERFRLESEIFEAKEIAVQAAES
ncbi:MAG: hypothetical protein ACI9CE_000241 [Flavobacterium sp.]|jgi:hypothetical protein